MTGEIGISLKAGNESTLKFEDFYNLDKRLRAGSYGTVYTTNVSYMSTQKSFITANSISHSWFGSIPLLQHKENGDQYAVKIIDRT